METPIEKSKNLTGRESINLRVNGNSYDLEVGRRSGQIDPSHTLAHVLRETLGFTGTKVSCDNGACGCCTVLMNGKAVNSCLLLAVECGDKEITTIEGLEDTKTGALDPLQQAFIEHTAFQCGYCTPGMILNAKALLNKKPSPDNEEIKEAISGVYCRCISHYQVIDAVKSASNEGR